MKKHKTAEVFLVIVSLAGTAIWYFTWFEYAGAAISGAAICLLLISRKGRKQLDKAAAIIEKSIMDFKNNQQDGSEKNLPD